MRPDAARPPLELGGQAQDRAGNRSDHEAPEYVLDRERVGRWLHVGTIW